MPHAIFAVGEERCKNPPDTPVQVIHSAVCHDDPIRSSFTRPRVMPPSSRLPLARSQSRPQTVNNCCRMGGQFPKAGCSSRLFHAAVPGLVPVRCRWLWIRFCEMHTRGEISAPRKLIIPTRGLPTYNHDRSLATCPCWQSGGHQMTPDGLPPRVIVVSDLVMVDGTHSGMQEGCVRSHIARVYATTGLGAICLTL